MSAVFEKTQAVLGLINQRALSPFKLFTQGKRTMKLNSVFFRFISAIYLKSFFIIFFALVGFFVGVDLLINFKDLPNSANLILLYVLFLACMAVSYVLPLSLVFALVLCLANMVRSNELVSFYALGLSKKQVIAYPFFWSLFFCALFVGLNFTPFAYAEDYQTSILRNAGMSGQSKDIFLKYDDKFIYIQRLESLDEKVESMKIFELENFALKELFNVQSASFKDNEWILESGERIKIPQNLELFGQGLGVQRLENESALKGFKPRIIESVANQSSYSISDALLSLFAFGKENVNTTPIRTQLYGLLFTPFFAPFLSLILFVFFPSIGRFFNPAFLSFVFFLCALSFWGLLYLAAKLTQNGLFSPELGIIAPIFALIFVSLLLFYRKTRKI